MGFWSLACQAQGFAISSNQALSQGRADQEMSSAIYIQNQTARPIELRWERKYSQMPPAWEALICPKNCLNAQEKGSLQLNPQEQSGPFRVSFRPNGQNGTGHVELAFYVLGQADKSQSVIFTAQTSDKNKETAQVRLSTGTPRLYPNPATEYLLLSAEGHDIKTLELYNVMGRKVMTHYIQYEGEKFNISDLPKGMYMVRMLDAQHRVIRTQSINKYNP